MTERDKELEYYRSLVTGATTRYIPATLRTRNTSKCYFAMEQVKSAPGTWKVAVDNAGTYMLLAPHEYDVIEWRMNL